MSRPDHLGFRRNSVKSVPCNVRHCPAMHTPWDDLTLTPVAAMNDGGQRFRATISRQWIVATVPQGGFVTALAARAMATVVDDPAQALRSVTSVFAGPVVDGPVEIDVRVLRRGRTLTQCLATITNPGSAAGLSVIAVFGARRAGFDVVERIMPTVPGPMESWGWRDPVPADVDFAYDQEPPPFWSTIVEGRPSLARRPWEPVRPGPAESFDWYRFDQPPILPDGTIDPAAIIVLADSMPGALDPVVDDIAWFAPSADLTVHVFGTLRSEWTLAHARIVRATEGYASAVVELWDSSTKELVAHATQVMIFVLPR